MLNYFMTLLAAQHASPWMCEACLPYGLMLMQQNWADCALTFTCLLQLTELRSKLEELHSTASADHLAKVDLETKQLRLHGDSSRLEKRLAALEADREALTQQLKVSI